MKKHITVNQMKEISDKELAKYMDLHFTHLLEAVCYYGADRPLGRDKLSEMSRMITIGKMIEIIKDNGYDFIEMYAQNIEEESDVKHKEYIAISSGELYPAEFFEETICDALWEAVKYVLEEDNNEPLL
jgi:hypothetical protein